MTSQLQTFPHSVLLKAERLIRFNQVRKISPDTYLAKAHSNTALNGYLVKRNSSGIWTCMCQGYRRRGICSHAIAVFLIESRGESFE